MLVFVAFIAGFVLGLASSAHICRSFKSKDALELTILKLQNERLSMDVKHYKGLAEQLKTERMVNCEGYDHNFADSCNDNSGATVQ